MRVVRGGVILRELSVADAPALVDLLVANREFLRPWEPTRADEFFALRRQRREMRQSEAARRAGVAYDFGIREAAGDRLVGRITLSNVVRGAWQNATVGYFVDESHGGRGYATEAVRRALDFAFGRAALHRVQAGVMPRNARSLRVLEKNRFHHEGLAPRYLQIDGVWEDHLILAITREEWDRGPSSGMA